MGNVKIQVSVQNHNYLKVRIYISTVKCKKIYDKLAHTQWIQNNCNVQTIGICKQLLPVHTWI